MENNEIVNIMLQNIEKCQMVISLLDMEVSTWVAFNANFPGVIMPPEKYNKSFYLVNIDKHKTASNIFEVFSITENGITGLLANDNGFGHIPWSSVIYVADEKMTPIKKWDIKVSFDKSESITPAKPKSNPKTSKTKNKTPGKKKESTNNVVSLQDYKNSLKNEIQ